MARLHDTFISKPDFYNHKAPLVDLKQGGTFGHMMDYKALVSATPYVRQHLVAVLIESPRGFDLMPNPNMWHRSLKAIIETQSKSITGLESTLSIANVQHNVGGAGEEIYAVSDVTRAVSNPQHSVNEKYNMPATTFFNSWIMELMMDPDTKYPNIITRPDVPRSGLTDHLIDFYSATVLYFEPDPLFRNVIKSWLCYGLRPKDNGPTIEGSRDLTSAKEELVMDISFTATTQVGAGVNDFAQKILNILNPINVNPWQRPAAVQDISAVVKAAADTGYREEMVTAAQVALKH